MAFILTYNTLVGTITSYLERSDPNLVANIPTFIMLAQNRINRDLKTLLTEQYVSNGITFKIEAGQPDLAKPIDWRQTLSFNIATGTNGDTSVPLQLRSYDFCRQFWPNPALTGQPIYYSDYGSTAFLLVPTPDQSYPFELSYLSFQRPIDITTQTNQVTEYAPELLIYGSLLETASFLKDDDRLPLWTQYYQDALNALKVEDIARKTTRYSEITKD